MKVPLQRIKSIINQTIFLDVRFVITVFKSIIVDKILCLYINFLIFFLLKLIIFVKVDLGFRVRRAFSFQKKIPSESSVESLK
jgi:hypothetical protein